MPNLNLKVGPFELEDGVPGSSTYCPITLALSPHLLGFPVLYDDGTVTVFGTRWVTRITPGRNMTYERQLPDYGRELASFALPPEAVLWMKDYDMRGKKAVRPFSFTVQVPEEIAYGHGS